MNLRPLKMSVQGVQDEQLGVINTPPRPVSKLNPVCFTSLTNCTCQPNVFHVSDKLYMPTPCVSRH